MFLEPNRTPYDVHFSCLGIPVRVHPLFWLFTALLGFSDNLTTVGLWIAVVFVSILVHEMGHALTMRHYGYRPHITLYAMGGLASYGPSEADLWGGGDSWGGRFQQRRTPLTQIVISFAGPLAGFLLAAVIIAVLMAANVRFDVPALFDTIPIRGDNFLPQRLYQAVAFLLYVNILWGLVNLAPIFPLDGGQIARQVFVILNPWNGLRYSLILSIAAAIAVTVWAFNSHATFAGVFFASMAFQNYAQLQQTGGGYW